MRNWTIKDAVATIQNGKDTEAIKEIAKHFPVFFMAVAKNDLGALAAMMTDKMTVRRLAETDDVDATDADEEAEANDEEAAVEAEDAETEDGGDLDSMSTKQLIALCAKRGIKVPKYGKNKAFYLAALQGGSAETDDVDDDAEEAEADPYAGKNALQLYSICKRRGLKMEPRQKASVYLEALKKADAKAAKAEKAVDEDDGDWNDEEEEAPKKSAKKEKVAKKSAPAKKSTKKAEPREDEDAGGSADDDDDWEI